MGDAENAFPSSKKRAAGREISHDNPDLDDNDATEEETGTFKRASEEVLATRKIVKVRRHQSVSTPSSSPFAGICLVPPTESSSKIDSPINQSHPDDNNAVSEVVSDASLEGKTEERGVEAAAAGESNGTSRSSRQLKSENDGPAGEVTEKEEKSSTEEAPSLENNDKKTSEATDLEKDDKKTSEATDLEKDDKKTSEATDLQKDDTKTSGQETGNEAEEDKKAASGEETKDEVKEADNDSKNTSTAASVSVNAFQQLSSSQNAFTGLAGCGFASSSLSFGSIAKDGSTPTFPSFSFCTSNNGSSPLQLFSVTTSDATKREGNGLPSMKEVHVETGEENEEAVFSADAVLFEYLDGGWKERGKGELKVNLSTKDTKKARLVMRARGNYRLILNANLYPDMKLANMDKKGVTFACMNSASEGKEGLTTFALKFKDASILDKFRGTVMAHKGEKPAVLKTPENSPKASDD